jgi:hypothetical protein
MLWVCLLFRCLDFFANEILRFGAVVEDYEVKDALQSVMARKGIVTEQVEG